MKISIYIILLSLFNVKFVFAQKNIKIHPKIISFKQTKLSLGIGGEFVPSKALMINASTPEDLKIIYKDPRKNKYPYSSYGFIYELYSANSIVGLLGGTDFSKKYFGFSDTVLSKNEFFEISTVEIPLYLKFRIGSVTSSHRLLLLVGGIYNIPKSCKREQFYTNFESYTIASDDSNDQLKSYFSLSGMIGYELFFGKQFRVALYSKVVFPMSNEFNSNYVGFKYNPNNLYNSALTNYENFNIRTCRVSFGLRFMLQFETAIRILGAVTTVI